jgi:hypothetical protein
MTDFTARRASETVRKRKHREELEAECRTAGAPKAALLYELAWDFGHASGYEEVALYYRSMADLVR